MEKSGNSLPVLVAILVAIFAIAALKATTPITMPLAFAIFIAVLVHPLHHWLNRRFPEWLSLTLVMLGLAGIFALAFGALEFSVELVAPKAPQYLDRLQEIFQTVTTWAQDRGIPIQGQPLQSQSSIQQYSDELIAGLKSLWSSLGLFVLTVALLVLLLLEVEQYQQKVKSAFSSPTASHILTAFHRMGNKFRGYLLIRTITSGITGVLTGLFCWILGVELAFVWGLLSFLLNYIPTLGSIISVIPPSLFALLFLGMGRGIATLVGLAAIQLALGNFVDPRMQGNSLNISPFVVLVSIVFWGWVWGIPGALLGVPLTVSIVVFCSQFERLRSLAVILQESDESDKEQE
ncbi:AI-2E family transporter [Phormidium sp. CCY1219]|uniref:AI-2E family transporter n=1 Tax=Phormidium sp. CCY1219 TaxID=2886104 RepID=UPI002D1EEBCB|nr:AI-2E family transporter [Phormidium sp. CCY1219]MEB3826951.1 AI-2E family transporter [Phormidium sp. CCY1219]